MTRISITVPETVLDYAERQVSDGRFGSTDEFFEEAVRTDRDRRPLTMAELHARLDRASAGGISSRQLPDIMGDVEAKLRADGRL
ncbi:MULTISPECIES: type II toxin-antitoxin system ParD family antitoxin [unclassified Aureimonas]|uniref:ribbon-helix-helix domain-containing protein n=1 Tax=unclassified Aureimonas TaxID=2615206 RepID=UPI000701A9CC|nr:MULTISPECIES: hypothetical protein [unclassified Aureimonas]KQT64105.1 hypothetical protein ASG62_03615 [Aureimonas sp. Leaf427]KQT81294.1 hypothetical protein ASG54_00885 [Aureimonas sp. Leaf460]